PTDPLRQNDDIRLQAHALKTEVGARASTTGLNVIDDEKSPRFTSQALHILEPLLRRLIDAPFGLNHFDNECRGLLDPAGSVKDFLLEGGQRINVLPQIPVVRNADRVR